MLLCLFRVVRLAGLKSISGGKKKQKTKNKANAQRHFEITVQTVLSTGKHLRKVIFCLPQTFMAGKEDNNAVMF